MNKMMIRTAVLAAVLVTGDVISAGFEESEMMKIVRQLQREVEQQQQEINALKEQLLNENTKNLAQDSHIDSIRDQQQRQAAQLEENRIDSYAALKEVAGVELGKGIDGLKISGDARFRYEARERNKTESGGVRGRDLTRDRYRVRLRIGGVWQNSEDNWEIGVGLALGSTGLGSATSSNDTLSDDGVFETGDINLDYAYARHSWDDFDLVIGQQKSPWKDTTTFILWDGDVRPVGITGKYRMDGVFLTGGGYLVRNYDDEDGGQGDNKSNADAFLLAGQAGYNLEADDMAMTMAVGYWHYASNANDADNEFLKNKFKKTSDFLTGHAEFSIVDVFGKATVNIADAKISLIGHYAVNLGADKKGGSQADSGTGPGITLKADDEDTAWLFGGRVGIGPLEFKAEYAHIEADSVYAPVKDSDFGDTAGLPPTNVEGFSLGIKYKFTQTMSLGWTYMDLELIEKTSDYDDMEGDLHQLDLIYKF